MTDPKREARLVLQAQSGDETLWRLFFAISKRVYFGTFPAWLDVRGRKMYFKKFFKICRNLKWLREPELFRPWAYRIASRESFALLKRERRWANPN